MEDSNKLVSLFETDTFNYDSIDNLNKFLIPICDKIDNNFLTLYNIDIFKLPELPIKCSNLKINIFQKLSNLLINKSNEQDFTLLEKFSSFIKCLINNLQNFDIEGLINNSLLTINTNASNITDINFFTLKFKYDESLYKSLETELENLGSFAEIFTSMHNNFLKIGEYSFLINLKNNIKDIYEDISNKLIKHSHIKLNKISSEDDEVLFYPKIKIFFINILGKKIDIDKYISYENENENEIINLVFLTSKEILFGLNFDIIEDEKQKNIYNEIMQTESNDDFFCFHSSNFEKFFTFKNESMHSHEDINKKYNCNFLYSEELWKIKNLSPSFYLIGVYNLYMKEHKKNWLNEHKDYIINLEIEKINSFCIKYLSNLKFLDSNNSIFKYFSNINNSILNCILNFTNKYLLFKLTYDDRRTNDNFKTYQKIVSYNSSNSNNNSNNIFSLIGLMDNLSQKSRLKLKVCREKELFTIYKIYYKEILNDLDITKYDGYVEYNFKDEIGEGIGPTKEFYINLFSQFQNMPKFWTNTTNNFLYPSTNINLINDDYLKHIELLGFMIARTIFDDELIDFPLCSVFFDVIFNRKITSQSIYEINSETYKVVKELEKLINIKRLHKENSEDITKYLLFNDKKIEDLSIYFVLPFDNEIKLKENGESILLTLENIEEYVELINKNLFYDEGITKVKNAFIKGFNNLFDISKLECFTSIEIQENILTSSYKKWDEDELKKFINADHGYNKNSSQFIFLIKYMSYLDNNEQKNFLKFTTGSTRLPIGGFKELNPKLTVVKRVVNWGENPDLFLPSVMTCQNYLKIPEYSTYEIFVEKINLAISEGGSQFFLS